MVCNADEMTRMIVLQLLAVVALWLVFLVTQQQKSRYGRCTWPFAAWFVGQTALLLTATALAIRQQVRKMQNDADSLDPELREMLLGHSDSEGTPTVVLALTLQAMCTDLDSCVSLALLQPAPLSPALRSTMHCPV